MDLLLLQPRRLHKVHQEGIRLLGFWYMHALLGDYVGDSVLIRYDPTNLAIIRVYVVDSLEEERFLCQAESVERGGQGVTLREVVDARGSHRKQVGEKVRERKQTVTRYASPKVLARRALSRLGSLEKPSQDVSAISETTAPEIFPETSGISASKMRWYDADEGEIALSVAAIPNADDLDPLLGGGRREIWYNPNRRASWANCNRPPPKNSSNKRSNSLEQAGKVKHKLPGILVFLIVH